MRDAPETFNLVKSKLSKQCEHCLLSYGHQSLSLGRTAGGCDLTARAERPHWAARKTPAIQPRTLDGSDRRLPERDSTRWLHRLPAFSGRLQSRYQSGTCVLRPWQSDRIGTKITKKGGNSLGVQYRTSPPRRLRCRFTVSQHLYHKRQRYAAHRIKQLPPLVLVPLGLTSQNRLPV